MVKDTKETEKQIKEQSQKFKFNEVNKSNEVKIDTSKDPKVK